MRDVVRGLRQALVMLVCTAAAAAGIAAVVSAAGGGGFRRTCAITAIVLAALLALTGGNALSRGVTDDIRAFLGHGPDTEDPYSGEGLTALGVFLFVSVPLFAGGLVLLGDG